MSQTGYTVTQTLQEDNTLGPEVISVTNLSDFLRSMATFFSGATAPSDSFAGQSWLNTSDGFIYIRNNADTSWTKSISVEIAAPALPSDVALGVPTLDAGVKIQTAHLPNLAITSVSTAADEPAQLALVIEEGDVVIRTDETAAYMHNGGIAGDMTDFNQLSIFAAASETVSGVVELATLAEVATGTDTARAVTSAGVAQEIATALAVPVILQDLNDGTNSFDSIDVLQVSGDVPPGGYVSITGAAGIVALNVELLRVGGNFAGQYSADLGHNFSFGAVSTTEIRAYNETAATTFAIGDIQITYAQAQ